MTTIEQREPEDATTAHDATLAHAHWRMFAVELAEALAAMTPETYLIISAKPSTPGAGRYLQFAATDDLRAEASSNAYLHGDEALDPGQEAMLDGLGWATPNPGDKGQNRYRMWEAPAPHAEVADLAVQTLVRVFDVGGPSELEYRYASFDRAEVGPLPLSIDREGSPAVEPADHQHDLEALRSMVEEALKRWIGIDQIGTDKDGDWPIRLGSAMGFVRIMDGLPPTLTAFSLLLRDVAVTAELLAELNSINSTLRYVRVFVSKHTVYAAMELPAVGLTPEAVTFMCNELGNVADHLDDQLHGQFGGSLIFDSSPKLVN